jgi:SUMO ligase MMS21 Smc5/6 complex component
MALYATKFGHFQTLYETAISNVDAGIDQVSDMGEQLHKCINDPQDPDMLVVDQNLKTLINLRLRLDSQKNALHQLSMLLGSNQLESAQMIHEYNKLKQVSTLAETSSVYLDYLERIGLAQDARNDDELQMVTQSVNYKCPITMTVMTDPWTSKTCNHSYSHEIVNILRADRRCACPVSGCFNELTMDDIYKDALLAAKIRRWQQDQ